VDSATGFAQATDDLVANLKQELTAFQERVKASPGEVQIEHRPGYTGVGTLPAWFAGALALVGAAGWLGRRKKTV
jgi:rhombotail lipoprotein